MKDVTENVNAAALEAAVAAATEAYNEVAGDDITPDALLCVLSGHLFDGCKCVRCGIKRC